MGALVAAFVSYRHALQVVRAHSETGPMALAYPDTAGSGAGSLSADAATFNQDASRERSGRQSRHMSRP